MRTLTSPTATEKNRQTGASFVRILEIDWGAGPVYYSDVPRTSPVVCQGRVLTWGPLNLQAEPGRVGGHQQAQIELQDADHAILALMAADAVAKRTVRIHLWFTNTTWPTDRLTLFAGTINGRIEYNDTAATWSFGVKGAESLYDKTLGVEINRKTFPATLCNECSGKIIPVVYGANVRRIPCCPLGRPAKSYLTQDLGILADFLQISRSIVDMGLEYDTQYTLRIGTRDSYENVLVVFEESLQVSGASGDTDGVAVGTIISRGSTLASGVTSPLYGAGGLTYMVIAEADLEDPDRDLRGFVIIVETPQGWQSFVISEWIDIGNGRAVVPESEEIDFAEGQPWKILTTVGQIPVWPTGTEVTIGGEYKFAVSHTPLESVDVLEVKGTVNNGGQTVRYFELAPEDYTVTLDDTSFNDSLDRGPGDPGITTVTINFSPKDYGSEDDIIYITGSHELTDPIDIITDILQSEWLGNIDPSDYPVDSTGAASDITPAFALTEPFKLHDTVSDLAQQCGLLLFWDGGNPHCFHWQWLSCVHARRFVLDMDGVICEDWSGDWAGKEADRYADFLTNARPLHLPRVPVLAIVTGRLEQFRPQTEAWLRRHGVEYGALVMNPGGRTHAEFKADAYASLGGALCFVESSEKQAVSIHGRTGKPVLSTASWRMHGGAPIEMPPRLGFVSTAD